MKTIILHNKSNMIKLTLIRFHYIYLIKSEIYILEEVNIYI